MEENQYIFGNPKCLYYIGKNFFNHLLKVIESNLNNANNTCMVFTVSIDNHKRDISKSFKNFISTFSVASFWENSLKVSLLECLNTTKSSVNILPNFYELIDVESSWLRCLTPRLKPRAGNTKVR